jgi:hypothetical protein
MCEGFAVFCVLGGVIRGVDDRDVDTNIRYAPAAAKVNKLFIYFSLITNAKIYLNQTFWKIKIAHCTV